MNDSILRKIRIAIVFLDKILKIKAQLDNYRVGRQCFPFAMMLSVW